MITIYLKYWKTYSFYTTAVATESFPSCFAIQRRISPTVSITSNLLCSSPTIPGDLAIETTPVMVVLLQFFIADPQRKKKAAADFFNYLPTSSSPRLCNSKLFAINNKIPNPDTTPQNMERVSCLKVIVILLLLL